MKICFVPIDNRPVCYNLAKDICALDKSIELMVPQREILGGLNKTADIDALFSWLKNAETSDVMVLSLDTLAYGGLISSRRSSDKTEEIKARIEALKPILKNKKVYAFSSVMRISNNNFNIEEKEYWNIWGKKIFEYSYNLDKYGKADINGIPESIMEDYIETRRRNFDINKMYLAWQKEGLFDTLIFSKDDCAEFGLNVKEAKELEKMGGKIKTGADEIPLTLLARAIQKDIKIYPIYTEPDYKNCISNYEDISIEQSVNGQLELGGFEIVSNEKDADIVLVVNNFMGKQGEHVMNWETQPYNKKFIQPQKPYAVADVRYANGSDNNFVKELLKYSLPEYGYSAWNTSANSLGSLLAAIKIKFKAQKYNDEAFKKLQFIRFLDDWAYQANVRKAISSPCDIKSKMNMYESKLYKYIGIDNSKLQINYIYPWNRTFEIEINLNGKIIGN